MASSNSKKPSPAKKNIAVVGAGYVGLVTGACLARLGHRVVLVDSDRSKIDALKKGRIPIHEPGLDKLVAGLVAGGRLHFVHSVPEAMKHRGAAANVIFIAVGTPPRADGSADLSSVEKVAETIATNLMGRTLIVEKSTVPVETGEWILRTIQRFNRRGVEFDVASNPEFLREGTAIEDFLKPDRIVFGVASAWAEAELREVYAGVDAPVVVTDLKSAEMIKHASNSFLATKISFINAIANVCEKTGADITDVARGMGLDKRIGPSFLKAGLGYGGFCLPPDERVIVRDDEGTLRGIAVEELYLRFEEGRRDWQALSLDPATDRLEFRAVTAVGRRRFHGLLVELKTARGGGRVTSDHPVLVRAGRDWIALPAASVSASDWVPWTPLGPRRLASGAPSSPRREMAVLEAEPITDQLVAVAVEQAGREPYVGDVYSLEVEHNETFALESGLIVHNCLPKDLEAFHWISKKHGYEFGLLKSVHEINEAQKDWVLRQVEAELWNLEGKLIGLWGLAFKPDTDDMRFAPSIDIVRRLQDRGVRVQAYDPVAMAKAKPLMKNVRFAKDPYDAAKGADGLIVVTEWDEFRDADLSKVRRIMKHPILVDGRNLFDPAKASSLGFSYRGVGRRPRSTTAPPGAAPAPVPK